MYKTLRFNKAFLLVVSLLFVLTTVCPAADLLGGGYLVAGTPFDGRARSAGVFNLYVPSNAFGGDRTDSIESLFFTAKSFRYVSDSRGDHWQSAEETEARRAGDCEDKAVWLFARLIQSGYYNVRLVIGKYRSIDRQFHVWVICSDKDGNTCLLDPAKQKRIWYLTAVMDGLYKPLYAYDGQNRYRYSASL